MNCSEKSLISVFSCCLGSACCGCVSVEPIFDLCEHLELAPLPVPSSGKKSNWFSQLMESKEVSKQLIE